MNIRASKPAIATASAFVALSILYCVYVWMQNANLFFEAQFLHYPFLKDLLDRHVTARGFFTVFGEHMFPGYNLILAANVVLFRIWGGFDNTVYAGFLIVGAALVVQRIYRDAPWPPVPRFVGVSLISLFLLSTVHNPMWGMALAAAGGVCLFVLCARVLESALWGGGSLRWFFVLFPIAQIIFLGGYGVGAIGAIGTLLLARAWQDKKVSIPLWKVGATVAVTVVIYVAITSHYSSMTANAPASSGRSVGLIGQFLVVMMGASVLGKSLHEQGAGLAPYYAVGIALIAATAALWVHVLRRRRTGDMFVLALSAYSLVNILAVAVFRYRNGLDGAMGQWYAVHTQFIPATVIWWAFDVVSGRMPARAAAVALGIAAGFAYHADWKKGEYLPQYKARYMAQAPIILAFPETIANKADIQQTMIWYYPLVKKSIDMMYQHHLWIFDTKEPVVSGLTYDGWLEADQRATVMCPADTRAIHFKMWRKEQWSPATVTVRANGTVQDYPANSEVTLNFAEGAPALVMFDATDTKKSQPVVSPPDVRKVVAVVTQVQCTRR